jgi:hypothetical protein
MASAFDYLPIIMASQQNDAARAQANRSNEIADRQFGIEREQFDYFKEQNERDRTALQPVIEAITANQQQNATFSKELQDRYKSVYQPLEDQLISDANSYASPERKNLEMGRAMALVSGQMEGQRRSSIRNLESFGIDPTAARYAGLDANFRAMSGANSAAAGNIASQNVDDTARKLRSEAIAIGQAYPGNANNASNSSVNAGNSAAGNTLNLTNTAANTTGTPDKYASAGLQANSNATSAINSGTAALNSMNSAYGNMYNNNNNMYNQSSGWGSLLGLVGGAAIGGMAGGPGGAVAGANIGKWFGGSGADGANTLPTRVVGGAGNRAVPTYEYAEGGAIPDIASPTGGSAIDDVPARLTAGEFVVPKDVATWKGEEFFQKLIEQSRKAKQGAVAKPEVGVAPQQPPTFVSRPQGGALPVG